MIESLQMPLAAPSDVTLHYNTIQFPALHWLSSAGSGCKKIASTGTENTLINP
jgi:hypothetical protein